MRSFAFCFGRSEEEDDQTAESSSDDSSSDEEVASEKKTVVKAKAATKDESSDESSDDSSDESEAEMAPVQDSEDSSDESDSDEEEESTKAKAKPASDSDDVASSEDESSDSEGSSDSDEEEEAPNVTPQKRKQESEAAETPQKKFAASGEEVSCTVRFGNLPWSVTDESLDGHLKEAGMSPVAVRLALDRETGRSRGLAFVEFNTPEEAQKAIDSFNEQEFEGRPIRVVYASATPRRDQASPQQRNNNFGGNTRSQGEPSNTLFVGNLSFNSNEDSVHSAFSHCGDIVGIRIPTDRESGRMKG